jgi:hypothetical protein
MCPEVVGIVSVLVVSLRIRGETELKEIKVEKKERV